MNVAEKLKSVFEWIGNIVGKGENAFSPIKRLLSRSCLKFGSFGKKNKEKWFEKEFRKRESMISELYYFSFSHILFHCPLGKILSVNDIICPFLFIITCINALNIHVSRILSKCFIV